MTKQPEALRLADESDNDDWIAGTNQWREEAATELRRLHTENARLFNAIEDSLKNYARVLRERHEFHEVNQELLEALKQLCAAQEKGHVAYWAAVWDDAQAAIAKATGEQA